MTSFRRLWWSGWTPLSVYPEKLQHLVLPAWGPVMPLKPGFTLTQLSSPSGFAMPLLHSPVPFIQKNTWILPTCTITHHYLLYFESNAGISKNKFAWMCRTSIPLFQCCSYHLKLCILRANFVPKHFKGSIMPCMKLLCTYLPSFKSMAAVLE